MNAKFLIQILLFHVFFLSKLIAQDITAVEPAILPANTPITILYDINIKAKKYKPGIEETYNGGNKTIFINGENARVRLVSLMRIQSIFFFPVNSAGKNVSIAKESGKKRYKYYLNNKEWQLYNQKYDSATYKLEEDSIEVLNYTCKKAVITLQDGKELVAYYTDQLRPLSHNIEPAFKGVPGMVLQYSYTTNKGIITYTARKLSEGSIDPKIFKLPAKGYTTKNYCSTCLSPQQGTSPSSSDAID